MGKEQKRRENAKVGTSIREFDFNDLQEYLLIFDLDDLQEYLLFFDLDDLDDDLMKYDLDEPENHRLEEEIQGADESPLEYGSEDLRFMALPAPEGYDSKRLSKCADGDDAEYGSGDFKFVGLDGTGYHGTESASEGLEERASESIPECGSDDLVFIDLNEPENVLEIAERFLLSSWRRAAAVTCACLALVCAGYTGWITLNTLTGEHISEQNIMRLRAEMQSMDCKEIDTETAGRETIQEKKVTKPNQEIALESLMDNPYAFAFSENEDLAAWLVVRDTVIDYPVMQTMEDEEYYLSHDFYGNPDKAGCLILDTDSSLEDAYLTSNLIIHGHNMKIGTMFGSLDEYRNEEYFQGHRFIELYTKEELRQYEVLAVFRSQVYYASDDAFKYYNFFHAETEEEFRYFYDNIKELSFYDTGVTAQPGDCFLTLSTCAYHAEDGRFVVVAKEIDRQAIGK